jgi:NTP pyrophosphatase (non-canonical NTP hydrolase)
MSAPTDSFVNITIAGTDSEPPAIELVRYDQFVLGLYKPGSIKEQKYHAALGIAGEAGEFVDAVKRELVYGKPLDRKNIVEELGDLRFYMQAAQILYGITDQEVLQANADKLAARYVGLKYSDKAAIDRADKNDPHQSSNS